MTIKELISKRRELKSKKPHFIRQDSHKKHKLRKNPKWIRPKGLHSKMRLARRGKRASVSIGWGANGQVKGLHKSGLQPIIVNSFTDLKKINSKTQGVMLGSIGTKKKLAIVKECEKSNIKILNIGNTKDYALKVEQGLKVRKDRKQNILAKKEESKKKLQEKSKQKEKEDKEKKTIEDSMSDEQKKDMEKKEMDKALKQVDF